jgi:hypothetical protein
VISRVFPEILLALPEAPMIYLTGSVKSRQMGTHFLSKGIVATISVMALLVTANSSGKANAKVSGATLSGAVADPSAAVAVWSTAHSSVPGGDVQCLRSREFRHTHPFDTSSVFSQHGSVAGGDLNRTVTEQRDI